MCCRSPILVRSEPCAIEFYKKTFGAKEVMRIPGLGGTIGHAEIQIGNSRIMLGDEYPGMNFRSPHSFGGTPVHIHLTVKDADRIVLGHRSRVRS